MKEILYKELQQVLGRRGFRSRDWAVEWDDSAIDFLLDRGFTLDMGARPLRRAIERYLLSPLAMTIVNHQFPEGEQFLFVRSDGHKIAVEFIDPDAPDKEIVEVTEEDIRKITKDIRLEEIILGAHGTLDEVEFLQAGYERLLVVVEEDRWQRGKQDALAQTASPGFWDSPDRFTILGRAEYMDRIETGLDTAGSLLRRLKGTESLDRKSFSRNLLQRLAQQIYLIDRACIGLDQDRPRDAFLLVEAGRQPDDGLEANSAFARRIGDMYRHWALLRKMRVQVLEDSGGDDGEPYRLLLAVIGFAAFSILEPEAGLHVLESPAKGKKNFIRHKVRVRIAPQPEEPAGHEPEACLIQARQVFSELQDGKLTIVRRYREEPSPLVRDCVRNWRTGNLERVLNGNFDLIC